jgi:hypothetical protein
MKIFAKQYCGGWDELCRSISENPRSSDHCRCGGSVSKAPVAIICGPVITDGAGDAVRIGPLLVKILGPVNAHTAIVLPEEPVCRDNTLPLSF